jgi:hypothetical protein
LINKETKNLLLLRRGDIRMMKHLARFSFILKNVSIQRWLLHSVAVAIALAGLNGCGFDNSSDDGVTSLQESLVSNIQIKTLSNRADLISGGEALMEILLPSGISFSSLSVDVDGRNVTSAFAVCSNGRITGVVTW